MSADSLAPKNHLQHESSPYLLQHAGNPVAWYPWCDEALQRAKAEDKPVFLSIGYSACHWCHVMEHESFEDEAIAAELNRHFVCIKVDREERPDLDQIYMMAVQMLTGRGGWPMSVFLTPDLDPFFGGTYWPPQPRMGMPGFGQVIAAVLDAWQNRREKAIEQSKQLTQQIGAVRFQDDQELSLDPMILTRAAGALAHNFDAEHGGFGAAPKFPHAMDLQLLWRIWQRSDRDEARQMATLTLDKMANGGIYDHLGGGFARYSVDEKWLVPHFEKMLYDNALLSGAYLDSYLATNNEQHRSVVVETLDYVLRDMTDPAGGFHSTEDADSEGEEGKFYVWSPDEIHEVLGADLGSLFCDAYGVTSEGNFEGQSILNLPIPLDEFAEQRGVPIAQLKPQLDQARQLLLQRRDERVRPGKDDKIIVSWNGLMIHSLARAARALDEARYLDAARRAAMFVQEQMVGEQGLRHVWRHGEAKLTAYLDDYAALANGLVALYEATFESRWIDWARELMDTALARFSDTQSGLLFYTTDEDDSLIVRPKDLQDGSVPSGNALAATVLIRLAHLTGRRDFQEASWRILESASGLLRQVPAAAGQLLLALDDHLGPFYQVVLVGDLRDPQAQSGLRELNRRFLPRIVLAGHQAKEQPAEAVRELFRDRVEIDGQPTFYVCEDATCWEPAHSTGAITELWERLSREGSSA